MIYNVYTDGSCNQGVKGAKNNNGGWAFVVISEDNNILFNESGFESDTTNNRAEMLAIIKAIECMCNVGFFKTLGNSLIINCDSAYIVNAFNDCWIEKWQNNGWKNSKGESVINQDYWNILIDYKNKYDLSFNKIKRRTGVFAKKVDSIARQKMRN